MAAAWREKLQPASFRGIPFLVLSADGEHGRRRHLHAYPLRDLPWAEDLGRKPRDVAIQGFVLEPGHIDAANALITACETEGSGTLVHPWLGSMTAVATDCRCTFSHAQGGMAVFQLRFVEAGDERYPEAVTNDAAATDEAAADAKDAVGHEFSEGFSLEAFPMFLEEEIIPAVEGAVDDIKEAIGPVVAAGETAARWARAAGAIVTDATQLVRHPNLLVGRVLGVLDIGNGAGIGSLVQTALAISTLGAAIRGGGIGAFTWRTFLPLTLFGLSSGGSSLGGSSLGGGSSSSTPARRQAIANQAAFSALVRRGALIEASRTAVRQPWATLEDAQAARTTLSDGLDREQQTASDPVYVALAALRAQMVRAVYAAAPTLPRLVAYTPRATRPALSIAHDLYGDRPAEVASRADALIARNRVRHPAFVPGGQDLQVVTRAA